MFTLACIACRELGCRSRHLFSGLGIQVNRLGGLYMAIEGLVDIVAQSPDIRYFHDQLRKARSEILFTGLSGSQKSLYIAALYNTLRGQREAPTLLLTHNLVAAQGLYTDLRSLLPETEPILLYPAIEIDPHEEVTRDLGLEQARLQAIEAILQRKGLVIAPVQAIAERLVPKEAYLAKRLTVTLQSEIQMDQFATELTVMGYERCDRVDGPGQFSVRGGIVDIYPPTEELGVRIELFDTDVDSIRAFDPVNQRSLEKLEEATIGPAREYLLPEHGLDAAVDAIEKVIARQASRLISLDEPDAARTLEERTARHIERLVEGVPFPGMDQYKPFFFKKLATLLDYVDEDELILVDEPARVREQVTAHQADFAERHALGLEKGRVLPDEMKLLASWSDLYARLKDGHALHLSGLAKRVAGMEPTAVVSAEAKAPESFFGQFDRLVAGLKKWRKNRYRICLVLSSEERSQRVADTLREEGVEARLLTQLNGELRTEQLVVTTGSLGSGCELTRERLVILTDAEVFGRAARRRPTRRVRPDKGNAVKLESFTDLKVRDYVVHVNHGIGQYVGMETLTIGDVHKDYLVVQYAGDDKLFVPTDQVDLLQKYIGFEEAPPKLYKLGGSEWARVKKRVTESVQEIADALLKLYAEREAVPGYAFAPDSAWQQEFEDAFPYEETEDQMRAIADVKADMERPRPMDRLLCGDVGYGKTEVAIRAAFKSVVDGKQVAVLVPTTILAQQHGRTFEERFEGFPIKIRTLSRFQSTAEQNKTLKEVSRGAVDVVIGTHRLISKDVTFRDLGLVIVDEEQRFGVVQKERLKEMRKNVDVLTLTATPIPRTLHMGLVGVRDMSLIETPPEDRFPIRTYVMEFDEELIREAILREIGRQGQVYFVYNRVQNIDSMFSRLQELVPEARIAVAHGQMNEDGLERVMLDFLEGEVDVLLCSTIIETGMDIANVNTLIVYDADRLGLAQLYQLRGRVGRSNRLAYAYFTHRRDKLLSEQAEKRLNALKEFTELGSGFKIAMRDLEIRGAGNLLGPEQHGFIASVGFELYCRLLEEAIKERKGEAPPATPDTVIDLNVEAYIPDTYIPDAQQKVEMYKKVAAILATDEADDVEDEFIDRFGDIPPSVQNLLNVARLKAQARQIGLGQIGQERDGVALRFLPGLTPPRELPLALMKRFRGHVAMVPGRGTAVKVRSRGLTDAQLLELLQEVVGETKKQWVH